MGKYFVKRAVSTIPVLLLVALFSFAIVSIYPGNFYTSYKLALALRMDVDGRQEALEQYEAVLALRGLDKPWLVQFYYWLEGMVVRGSLGFSFATGTPVTQEILGPQSGLWWTLIIVGSSVFIGALVGIPMGILGAAYYRSPLDVCMYSATYAVAATPPFVAALLFFVIYNLLNPNDLLIPGAWGLVTPDQTHAPMSMAKFFDYIKHLSLTWLIVGAPVAVTIARYLRASLLEILPQKYITTAKSKGLSSIVVLIKHALRNALHPIVSMSGFLLTATMTNSIIATTVLAQPSFGRQLLHSVQTQDQAMITSILLIYGVILVAGTLLSDLLLAVLDPRIRYD